MGVGLRELTDSLQTMFADHEIIRGAHWLTGTCELDMPVDEVDNDPGRRIFTRYVPLGVVVGIVPWNCTS